MAGSFDYFETPSDVARELACLIRRHIKPAARGVFLIDACSGDGRLSHACLSHFGNLVKRLTLADVNLRWVLSSKRGLAGFTREKIETVRLDLLKINLSYSLKHQNIVVCNPPFRGYRICNHQQKESVREHGLPPYNDVSTAFVLRIVKRAPQNTIFGFILRRDVIYSRGYSKFRKILSSYCKIVDLVDVGRRLKSGGKAAASIIILRKLASRRLSSHIEDFISAQSNLANPSLDFLQGTGWIQLKTIAHVVAGPNTGADRDFINSSESNAQVIRLPKSRSPVELWAVDRLAPIHWNEEKFSVRRNLRYQGAAGVVYRLCGADFVTGILPLGIRFLSSTPAIIPLSAAYLDLITGISLSAQWRQYVRLIIRSTNFTPGAVAQVLVPNPSSETGLIAKLLGESARSLTHQLVDGCNLEEASNGLAHVKSLSLELEMHLSDQLIFGCSRDQR